jgi:ketosteroid isomerase-like protein
MSAQEENANLVMTFMELVRDEGLGASVAQAERFMHPEVEWSPGLITMGQSTYRGIDAVRDHIRRTASVSGGGMTIQEVRPVGEDCVLALAYVDFRSKDESFYTEFALAVRVEDGKLREIRGLVSHAKAAAAVEEMASSATDGSSGA